MCCCNDGKQGCQKPEKLKGKPEDCTPEQIKECHGEQNSHPCVETTGCEDSERLKGQPGECSQEQIRVCHGETTVHLCE